MALHRFPRGLKVPALAREVGMSTSCFHQHVYPRSRPCTGRRPRGAVDRNVRAVARGTTTTLCRMLLFMSRQLAAWALLTGLIVGCTDPADPLDGNVLRDAGGSPAIDAGSIDSRTDVDGGIPGGLLLDTAVRRPRGLQIIEDGEALFVGYAEVRGDPMLWDYWSVRFTAETGFSEPTRTFSGPEDAHRGSLFARGGDGAIYGTFAADDRRAVGRVPAETTDWSEQALGGEGGSPALLSPIPEGARMAWATQNQEDGSWRLLVQDVSVDDLGAERLVDQGVAGAGVAPRVAAVATGDGQTAIFANIDNQWRMYWDVRAPTWLMEMLPWTDTGHVRAWFTDDGNLHYFRVSPDGLMVGDYAPGRGWSTEQTLGQNLIAPARQVVGDAAAVAWRVDKEVFVTHFHPSRGWTGPELVGEAVGGAVDVEVRDQSVGVVWLARSEDGAVRPRYRVFAPGTGWKPAQTVSIRGSQGAELPYITFVPGTDEPLIFWTLLTNPAFATWWARPEAP